jgi:dTDP-4-dehydrorhamnose 3,5-epimerase-like enzyme
MATLLNLKSIKDSRGTLTVLDHLEEWLPFTVRRIFFIQQAKNSVRGGHRHFFTRHAVICMVGSCIVTIHDGKFEQEILLDSPDQCLIIESDDWHTMHHFSSNAVLLALASTNYDPTDYIYQRHVNGIEKILDKKNSPE